MNSILCIDDDKTGLRIRIYLLRSFGFEVEGTTEPGTAMKLLQDRHFDIVVVDYCLSTMSGTELARIMKLKYPKIPVLLFSGVVEVPLGLEYVDSFLCKTDSPQKLVAAIRELLAARTSQAS